MGVAVCQQNFIYKKRQPDLAGGLDRLLTRFRFLSTSQESLKGELRKSFKCGSGHGHSQRL